METKTLKLVKSQNCEKIGKLGILVKILKRDITINSLVANQKNLKEEMKNKNTVLKYKLFLVLERRLDEKFDILNEKQKYLDDKMSTMTQNINTLTQNMSTMTQNHNTLIEM